MLSLSQAVAPRMHPAGKYSITPQPFADTKPRLAIFGITVATKATPLGTWGIGMNRRKVLHWEYELSEILLFAAAGMAICFVAAVMLAN